MLKTKALGLLEQPKMEFMVFSSSNIEIIEYISVQTNNFISLIEFLNKQHLRSLFMYIAEFSEYLKNKNVILVFPNNHRSILFKNPQYYSWKCFYWLYLLGIAISLMEYKYKNIKTGY